MNWNKARDLAVIFSTSFLLTVQYQNCAQSPAVASDEENSTVTVIDDVKADSDISFSTKEVEVDDSASLVVLEGTCPENQDEAILGWAVRMAGDGDDLANGYAQCQAGRFLVELAPPGDFECDTVYEVRARLGFGAEGTADVIRRCGTANP